MKLPILHTPYSILLKRAGFLLSAISVAIAGIFIYSYFNSKPAEAAWFDESWPYRQTISVTNNGSTQTNYQLQVIIDTASLITSKKLQSNCNDLRFANAAGTSLAYFLETGCNSSKTLVWVTVDSISAGSSNIFVYYGNSSAASASTYSSYPTGISLGNGADGACVVSADTNINSASCAGRATADAISTTVSANTASGQNQVTVAATTGLAVNDEILIINLQGTSGDNSNVGKFETARISSIADTTLTLNHNLDNTYNGTTQKIMVQRVPNYTTVNVSAGNLTVTAWDGSSGGVLFFRANSTITVTGTIHTNSLGFRGGTGATPGGSNVSAQQGEGYVTSQSNSTNSNYGGGGGGESNTTGVNDSSGGGGGGYSSTATTGALNGTGTANSPGGTGGGSYGAAALSTLFLGAGGGAGGGSDAGCGAAAGGNGGKGGGIVFISASTVTISGAISSTGAAGTQPATTNCTAGGGGGAGGSVRIDSSSLILGSSLATSTAGSGGGSRTFAGTGGTGSTGRIATQYSTTSGTTNPSANASAVPIGGSVSNEEKVREPVAYWKFDEGYGTTAYDTIHSAAGTSWWNSAWKFRKPITVSNSVSTQTDYQVMITLDTTDTTKFQNDCDDIRILDSNSNQLNYWLEPTSCGTSSTKIWTKISSLPASGTTLYVYYANPDATAVADATPTTNVFISEISNVQAAWNMDESSWTNDCSTGTVLDASSNSNNGKSCPNGSGTQPTAGKFNNAGSFDGSNDYMSVANNSTIHPTAALTFSAWVYPRSFADPGPGDYPRIVDMTNSKYYFAAYFHEDSSNKPICIWGNDDNTQSYAVANSLPSLNDWFHLVCTYESGVGGKMYINGTLQTSTASNLGNLSSDNTGTWFFSTDSASGNRLANQMLDDVNIYNKVLSTDDISALYGTGGDRQGYVTTNYANKELVREYSANVSVSNGTEAQSPIQNGNLIGSIPWQEESMCVSGKCLKLNGSSQYVSIPNSISNIQTVSFWVNPISTTTNLLDLDGGTHYISASSGTISATGFTSPTYYINGVATATPTLVANKWQLITVTTGTSFNGTAITIGKVSTNYFNGFMDEVKLYDYARSAAQIKLDYNSGKAGQGAVKGTSIGGGSSSPSWMSNGLLGYWKLDESSGNATDSSGNSLTLTNNSSMVYGAGKYGNSVTCDGSADYLNTGTTISGVKSVSLWVYPASAANNYFLNLINSSAYITIDSSGVVTATGFTSPSIYVNGVLNGTVSAAAWSQITITSGTGINANAFAVGVTNDGSNHFCTNTSKIDEIRAYNRSLTPKEVSDLYNWAPGPKVLLKMEEGTGTTANDTSGNSNNGTVNSGTWTEGKYGKGVNINGSSGSNVSVPDFSY